MKYKQYDRMKDSGIEWIGEIPEHWMLHSVKYGYAIQLGKMLQPEPYNKSDIEIPYLKAQHVLWEKLRIDDLPTMWGNLYDIMKYEVKDGDLLVCEGGEVGRACIAQNTPPKVIIQNAIHRVRNRNNNNLRYLMFVLEQASSSNWFDIICNKATIAHFTADKFNALQIPIPNSTEQRAIAAFLDRETSHIDGLIEKKERLIELLKEKRQALITRAVTRGLDPKVKMKDSGVEWIGEIPEHWEVRKLKHISSLRSGASITSDNIEVEGDYPVYGGNGLRGYTSSYTHEGYYILIGRQGALCGNINYANGKFWASEHAVVVTSTIELNTYWLGELLHVMNLNQYSVSAAQPGLSVEQIKNLSIPFPPLNEQNSIAALLQGRCDQLNAVIEKITSQILNIRELRQTLISNAVTGKIDVREEASA